MEEIQPNDFLYRIIIGTTGYDLPQSPIGWEENLINFKRDSEYWGIIKEFTVPLEFIGEGATICRSQFYQYGTEAFVRLEILQLNRITWVYERIFLGELDFSKPTDKMESFTCNVMQGGVAKIINAYKNVKYDIDLDPGITVTIPGVGISEKANSIIATGSHFGSFYPDVQLVINDLDSGFAIAQSTSLIFGTEPNPDEWIFQVSTPLNVRIFGSLQGVCSGCKIDLISTMGGITTEIKTIFYGLGDISIDFDININALAGQKFFIRVLQPFTTVTINEGTINISYTSATDPSTCKMISPKYLLEQILQKMNDNSPVTVSSYLFDNTDEGRIYVTSGNGIRGIPGSKVKSSLSDFWKSYGIRDASLSIRDEVVYFERFENAFLDMVTIADVGEVKECEFEVAQEYLYSSLKVGYKDEKYDEVDGKDEFNTLQNWTFPLTRDNKTLDLVSVFRADVRGIEDIRTNLLGQDISTIDAESDNDVFMIKLKPDLSGPEGIEAYTSVTGINSPQKMYNLDLSPKKILLRNSAFIASMLYFNDDYKIRFQSSDKNAELATTDLNGLYVKENEDIPVKALAGQLFIPLTANFTTNSPRNLQQMLSINPFGCIAFNYLGNRYRGYILEVSSDVSKNTEQEYKLLLSSSNNILNLIH